jgi:hypothetical protein
MYLSETKDLAKLIQCPCTSYVILKLTFQEPNFNSEYAPYLLPLPQDENENRTTVSSMHKKKTLFFRLEGREKREREKKKRRKFV